MSDINVYISVKETTVLGFRRHLGNTKRPDSSHRPKSDILVILLTDDSPTSCDMACCLRN